MKMYAIIDDVSELYRKEWQELAKLETELRNVSKRLREIEYTHGECCTLAEYNAIIEKHHALDFEVDLMRRYCDGISAVRELLMDYGFDTNVT